MHAYARSLERSTSDANFEGFQAAKAIARGLAEEHSDISRLRLARLFCQTALEQYWLEICSANSIRWKILPAPSIADQLDFAALKLAQEAGYILASAPVDLAGYLAGTLYTAMLPDTTRSTLGAYYTPPGIVERLMDLAQQSGFDWSNGSMIDPACGGGAFLAPAALRMWGKIPGGSAISALKSIASRLQGIEIDPFAGWMSRVTLEAAMLPLCKEANQRMPDTVSVADALTLPPERQFDLVIGNPPYGRVTLDAETRQRYARSLYGHANLYGLFTDLAMQLAKPGGVIAYVTPTSFLGGQYFKALRGLLAQQSQLCAMDFVTDREGVFDNVLQETMLAVFRRQPSARQSVNVHFLEPATLDKPVTVASVGLFSLEVSEKPWLLPRDRAQARILPRLLDMPHRLREYGYTVSTGPLVWNRHKSQLRSGKSGRSIYPLIWAESVLADGEFRFKAEKRDHVPYIQLDECQGFLIVRDPCVLIQRTTSKEQSRRLVAAVMPSEFLRIYRGAVVENHLNIVRRVREDAVSPETICALLNSRAVDRAYRCISGSVAVSAYELEALPLPDKQQMRALERLVLGRSSREVVEGAIARMYGVTT